MPWNITNEAPVHVAVRLEMPRESMEKLMRALTRRKRQAPDIKMLNDLAASMSAATGIPIPRDSEEVAGE